MEDRLGHLLKGLGRDGRDFERLTHWYLLNDPVSAVTFRKVWLWDDWPGRWDRDRGIDLVAERMDGALVAVQAKNYAPAHSVTKTDIDSFLSESNRPEFAERLLVATTDHLSRTARAVMDAQDKPVSTLLLSALAASTVHWPGSIGELTRHGRPPAATPRPHQQAALEQIDAWALSGSARGQLRMACGTGKTLICAWAADRLQARRVLVLVPTVALLRQTAAAWAQHAGTQRSLLQVCHRRGREDEDVVNGDELGTASTTDPEVIADALGAQPGLLVVSTYDSSATVAEAVRRTPGVQFDLIVADEAHRCAGATSSSHKTVLDADALPALRRLFVTATPTVFGTPARARARRHSVRLASMDDVELFGPVVHHLSFARAVEQELLCPYQVAIIPVFDEEIRHLIDARRLVTADGQHILEAVNLATQIACARAMRLHDCRRVVAFHKTIDDSKRFTNHLPVAVRMLKVDERPERPVRADHIDGDRMGHAARRLRLQRFVAEEPDEHRLLSNVRLLSEGVDVPSIDGVVFVSTQRSQSAIIQAVGRAMRPAPGKTIGTVVLPVICRDGERVDTALARSEHGTIANVLGALRSHDPDIVRSVDSLRFHAGDGDTPGGRDGRFRIDAPLEVGENFADAVGLALASALGTRATPATRRAARTAAPRPAERPTVPPTPDELLLVGFADLERAAHDGLLARVPASGAEGLPLGTWWWEEVLERWQDGKLTSAQCDQVAACVSWLWDDLPAWLRSELRLRTDTSLGQQIAAQLAEGGSLARGPLAGLWGPGSDGDALIEVIERVVEEMGHVMTSDEIRLPLTIAALKPLAAALRSTDPEPGEDAWYSGAYRRTAILDGYRGALCDRRPPDAVRRRVAKTDDSVMGQWAAEWACEVSASLEPYRFKADGSSALRRLRDELDAMDGPHLDALGWDVFLLWQARGGGFEEAVAAALDRGRRGRVRLDLLFKQRRDLGLPALGASFRHVGSS